MNKKSVNVKKPVKKAASDVLSRRHKLAPDFEDRLILSLLSCDHTLTKSKKILASMGFDIKKSIAFLRSRDGYCDCEVFLNVFVEDEPRRASRKAVR